MFILVAMANKVHTSHHLFLGQR